MYVSFSPCTRVIHNLNIEKMNHHLAIYTPSFTQHSSHNSQTMNIFLFFTFLFLLSSSASAQNCGWQGGNAPCSSGNCCSQYGYCGNTPDHCLPSNNCQYQCTGGTNPSTGGSDVGSIITSSVFDQMLKYRNDPRCKTNGFYAYNAFINAAKTYSGFRTTGSNDDKKRELAAFLAQTSHETTGIFLVVSRIHTVYTIWLINI